MDSPDQIVNRTRKKLLIDFPFFGSVLSSLPFLQDSDVGLFLITENAMLYNPEMVIRLTESELRYYLCREVMHIAMEHSFRRKRRSAELWALASEFAINNVLERNGLATAIPEVLFDRRFTGMSAEEIYNKLAVEFHGNPLFVKHNQEVPEGEHDTLMTDSDRIDLIDRIAGRLKINRALISKVIEETSERARGSSLYGPRMKERLSLARLAQLRAGKISVNIATELNPSEKCGINWISLIYRHMGLDYSRFSLRKFRRKYLASEIYLPGRGTLGMDAVLVLDVSASIDKDTVESFFSEAWNLIALMRRGDRLRIIQADADIRDDVTIISGSEETSFSNIRKGMGGTNFIPVFSRLNADNNLSPVFVLTDGNATVPEHPPDRYPVIWITSGDALPFGENIRYGDVS